MASDKDTVPGLGFKDKEKALETVKNLEGRDPDYQKLAVKGLIGRAKRTLQVTKAEDKLTNIKEALEFFEKWLKNFEKQHIPNWSYLPLVTVESFLALKNHFDIKDEKIAPFLEAYKSVDGDYKKLRTVSSGEEKPTWDIVRNNELRELMEVVDEDSPDMWDSDDVPTKIHTQLILWAYSPEANRIKKNLSNLQQKMEKFHLDEDTKENNKEDSENESKNDIRVVTLGSNVTLSCAVFADPPPDIEWYRNSKSIANNNIFGSPYTNTNMHYLNYTFTVQEEDLGGYYCLARNSANGAEANTTLTTNVTTK